MKKLIISVVLATVVSVGYSQDKPGIFDDVTVRLGASYREKSSELGASASVTKYFGSIGAGVEVIEKVKELGVEIVYGYGEYRYKLNDSISASLIAGAGWDEANNIPIGIAGVRAEYNLTKNLGVYGSCSMGISTEKFNRELLTGGGLSYSF